MTLPFNFTLKQIEFSYDPHRECFHHNLERDFHIFCVWEKARHLEKDIVRFLSEKFACVHVDEIAWSLDLCELNFARLYKWSNTESNGKARAVGTGPFLCILIEDTHPNYQYELSVSGVLELCNRNVLEAKREIRRWLGDYLVHSTGNPSELIEQASLFYPMAGSQQCSEQVEQTGFGNRPRDPIGSKGWPSFEALFGYLNQTTDYVVLREFEFLPRSAKASILDVLCSDPASFFSAVGAVASKQSETGAKCKILIGGESVQINVSFIGDGSLDIGWQKDILRRSVFFRNVIRVPRVDDYFFTLLHHVTLLDPATRNQYTLELQRVGRQIGIPDKFVRELPASKVTTELLRAYFKGVGYRWYLPSLKSLKKNDRMFTLLGRKFVVIYSRPSPRSADRFRHLLVVAAKKFVPRQVLERIPTRILMSLR